MRIKSSLIALLMTLILGGCTQYVWKKPIGDPQTYPTDNYACKQKAIELAPPTFQVYESSNTPYKSTKRIETHCSDKKSNKMCLKTVENKEYHPRERTIDLNASNRKGLYNACMESKGWVLTPVETQ